MSDFEDTLNDLQDRHGSDPLWMRLQEAHQQEIAETESAWRRENDHLRRVIRAVGAMTEVALTED